MPDNAGTAAEVAPEKTPATRDRATIIAISIVAFALANVLHEGAGHGGACLLSGGHAKVLSSVHFDCDRASRFISAGGTLVNFIVGFLCWIALRAVSPARGRLRYFLWRDLSFTERSHSLEMSVHSTFDVNVFGYAIRRR